MTRIFTRILLPALLASGIASHAAIWTLSRAEIDSLGVPALAELLQEIPGVYVSALDATDFIVRAGGGVSPSGSGVMLAEDGLLLGLFHDGRQWLESRTADNSVIREIQVLTGIHAWEYCDRCPAVINLVTLPEKDARPPKLHMKTYIGSEIGDPGLFYYVLPQDYESFNREQIVAGELAVNHKAGRFLHAATLSNAYMDRYSSRYEGKRSEGFDNVNHQSLDEHWRGSWRSTHHTQNRFLWGQAHALDYRTFRFSKYRDFYNHYDGTRAGARGGCRFFNRSHATTLNILGGATWDQAEVSLSKENSHASRLLAYAMRAELKTRTSDHTRYEIAAIHAMDAFVKADTILAKDEPSVTVSGVASFADKAFNLGLVSTPGFRLWGQIDPEKIGAFTWGVGIKGKNDTGPASREFELCWNGSLPFVPQLTIVVELEHGQQWPLGEPAFPDSHIWNYGLSGDARVLHLGRFFGSASQTESALSWRKSIWWNRLAITAGYDLLGSSKWRHPRLGVSTFVTLPSHGSANLQGSYSLNNDRVILGAIVRNIGSIHYQEPWGGPIGPIVITNLKIRLP